MCIVITCSLAVTVGVVNEKGGGFLFLNRKMSATALRAMIVHYGCFEDESASH